ncbi:cupin domain-containing protein [Streptomyces pseudogriseolus]|uniref:cupin domain-containing protein n=1 Tax=Streptomyces pseudogriseolus TaxID=36817 RepID=UPI0016771A36
MGALRFVVAPDEGKSIWLEGMGVDFKVWGEETGNQFSIVEHPIEPGRLVPPHVHSREDEFSFVLQGRVGARVPEPRVAAALRGGSVIPVPVPWTGVADADDFEKQLSPLRALHVRYGRGSLKP